MSANQHEIDPPQQPRMTLAAAKTWLSEHNAPSVAVLVGAALALILFFILPVMRLDKTELNSDTTALQWTIAALHGRTVVDTFGIGDEFADGAAPEITDILGIQDLIDGRQAALEAAQAEAEAAGNEPSADFVPEIPKHYPNIRHVLLLLIPLTSVVGAFVAYQTMNGNSRSSFWLTVSALSAGSLLYLGYVFADVHNILELPINSPLREFDLLGIGWYGLVIAMALIVCGSYFAQQQLREKAGRSPEESLNPIALSPLGIENPFLTGQSKQTVGDYIRGYFTRVRSGDLGPLPIILGLIIIAIIFQSQNENFLRPNNLVNLIVQMSGYATIAFGIVFVLLLGEIDLSVGYVSAVSAVAMTLLLREPNGWSWYTAVPTAMLMALGIGMLHGLLITTFQVPSFVVTLAGFMAWNGFVVNMIGGAGTVIIQDQTVKKLTRYFLPDAWGWIMAGAFVTAAALYQLWQQRTRKKQGLMTKPFGAIAFQIAVLAGMVGLAVEIANQDRGLPIIGVFLLLAMALLTFVAESTRFGRYVYATGGNKEAARRAGIKVEQVRVVVFMIASFMAGLGGMVLASRLSSVDTNAGGGNLLLNSIAAAVIGGTSLFGGSGKVSSAVLGALVIGAVDNGMGLLGLPSGTKFIITGMVLLLAVIVDSVARRSQQRSGIA